MHIHVCTMLTIKYLVLYTPISSMDRDSHISVLEVTGDFSLSVRVDTTDLP